MEQKVLPFSQKQCKFLIEANATWNLAHGAVRTGKTIITLYSFMFALDQCPDNDIWMIGYTSSTIHDNVVKLLYNSKIFSAFRPFLSKFNHQNNSFTYKNKLIRTCGAADGSSVGRIQGQTISLLYCDEMTLFPLNMIHMLDTRLSASHSKAFAAMNPASPSHILKEWIDKAQEGDERYYAMHFTLADTDYVSQDYKDRIKSSLTGVFFKRNYMGIWCMAEGAIYECFDTKIHVLRRPPKAAEYWVAGIDYGVTNAFGMVVIGVSTGRYDGSGKMLWVEEEYYWNSSDTKKQMVNSEYAEEVQKLVDKYGIRLVYMDPSAASMKVELRRRGIHVIDAENDVVEGIHYTVNEMQQGRLFIVENCKNLIKEIQGYVWDTKQTEKGYDKPKKERDHLCVSGQTEVLLFKGNPISFSSYKANASPILGYKKTQENVEVFELELEDGKKLTATADHEILTDRGYIALNQLTLSDIIMTCKNTSDKDFISIKIQDIGSP
ncbi:MAG: PBSX family phage terminase large subunit [Patescibacteria group bacterium]|nr:PBSX family phage terminase large subunit [Patescibacteria group bacterium]MDE2438759.1 PBSX family phage terminase large subunit [Patescibacteria group bacterium]